MAQPDRSAVPDLPRRSTPEFDRTPPQDIPAEQSVLGGMLLSKDAIADVIEVLRPTDFYRPAHQTVCDAILDLYGRGEPADPITVSAELVRTGQIARVGGAGYLHTLMSSVPTAANAGYYAAIVAEQAILRRLVEAGTRIVQMGYGAAAGNVDLPGSVDDVVDRAQAEVYDVTERRTTEDYVVIEKLLEGTLDEIERISASGGVGTGIPTGFHDLDQITNGLHPGQMITIAGRPGSGKALALDTPLATPSGWTTMGAVAVGDLLVGADGRPARVVAATEVLVDRPCYEIGFSDGSTIVADAEHQWVTSTRASRRAGHERQPERWTTSASARARVDVLARRVATEPDQLVTVREATEEPADVSLTSVRATAWSHGSAGRKVVPTQAARRSYDWRAPAYSRRRLVTADAVRLGRPINSWHRGADPEPVTTQQIARTLRCPDGRLNHSIACTQPLELPDADLLVPPYTLGAWLGDGTSDSASITTAAPEILDAIHAEGVTVPRDGSLQARLRKLGVLGNKHIPDLYLRGSVAQRRALLAGLLDTDGYAAPSGCVVFAVTNRRLAEQTLELVHSLGYRATLRTKPMAGRTVAMSTCYIVAFTPDEPVFRLTRKAERQSGARRTGTRSRFITAVRPLASVPVRCVQVDNPDRLYLAGRSMIPTHNSTLALDMARSAAIKHGQATAVFSLEMGKLEIMMRLFSAEARVLLKNMRSGMMSDEDWTRMARRSGELAEAPLYIDDSPNLTMMEIRAKARRLKQRHDLKLIVIDYLQLMTSGKRVESRQQEVSEFSRAMKLLAKEIDVPVIALSQLNRGPEQRTDKKPLLSDLRESGCLPASARIWRADTGAETTIGEMFETGVRDVPVWSFDDHLRLVPRRMSKVFRTGVKEVFRLTLSSGRTIDATANHPILALRGWTPLGELSAGQRVAIPRRVPDPSARVVWPDYETILLAHLLGDGSFVPEAVFGLPQPKVALFLHHLWSTDGCIHDPGTGQVRIYYASTSRRLADDVARLLTRFGITARIKTTRKADYRPCFQVHVYGSEAQRIFLGEIGAYGSHGVVAARALVRRRDTISNTNVDTVPREVWDDVRQGWTTSEMTHRQFSAAIDTKFCGSTLWKAAPGRSRLHRVAKVLHNADLEILATNDVHWDTVVSIEPLGQMNVFDATVHGTHNFVADGVAVHNSIEQDSDMVLLVHREDMYERESPRAGEADLIIAKHRNGPTGVVTVAFQGHYSRFVDMGQ